MGDRCTLIHNLTSTTAVQKESNEEVNRKDETEMSYERLKTCQNENIYAVITYNDHPESSLGPEDC